MYTWLQHLDKHAVLELEAVREFVNRFVRLQADHLIQRDVWVRQTRLEAHKCAILDQEAVCEVWYACGHDELDIFGTPVELKRARLECFLVVLKLADKAAIEIGHGDFRHGRTHARNDASHTSLDLLPTRRRVDPIGRLIIIITNVDMVILTTLHVFSSEWT